MEMIKERHPKGLYVLFGTEMWERFSFYTMLAMLVLYMKDVNDGFGMTTAEATNVYSWYTACVYASPLIGGFLADRYLGTRWAITIGAVFFFVGQLMLSAHNLTFFYCALGLLVLGNGFFKPNISSSVGNLYDEGSRLKDRAYLIFYMGINIGAALAPLVAELIKSNFGYGYAFSTAAFGMMISMVIFWGLKRHIENADRKPGKLKQSARIPDVEEKKKTEMDLVPAWKRVLALILIFIIVIVFWMIFHQNGSTLTLWANDHTAWSVTGIISNMINPVFIIVLALPLSWFWGKLDKAGLEPSTPAKMAIGMLLTGVSFVVLYFAAVSGNFNAPAAKLVSFDAPTNSYGVMVTKETLDAVKSSNEINTIELGTKKVKVIFVDKLLFEDSNAKIGDFGTLKVKDGKTFVDKTNRVSPLWLILAYLIISLGELMLSPMGLSLVSKVAPVSIRGLMMGGWFLATAIGNKLTAIGVYWDVWSHSKFFITLAFMAFVVAAILFVLIKPLKKIMPGA
ncbi:MAG: peptide MFS transporter [Deltaproteobacteria bacterium]|nr:peptide MFS transporter [Deltaproteobacteria bacterium]